MPIHLFDAPGLPANDLYRQIGVATGSQFVFVAGQVSCDADGQTVGRGDLVAQVEQCCVNLDAALGAAGATYADVAKVTAYFVDWTPDKMPLIVEGITRASGRTSIVLPGPPLTGIGVAALADPDHLVEIEATAVIG